MDVDRAKQRPFPTWWKEKTFYNCSKKGHISLACKEPRKQQAQEMSIAEAQAPEMKEKKEEKELSISELHHLLHQVEIKEKKSRKSTTVKSSDSDF